MQPLALHLVNSIFLGDYLTSEGQAGQADLDMIADAGFEVEGAETTTLPAHRRGTPPRSAGRTEAGAGRTRAACGPRRRRGRVDGCAPARRRSAAGRRGRGGARAAGADLVSVRRRGAGTDLPPNA